MVFTLPADADQRPVVIDGAGTLGRRIAAVYEAGGNDVRIFDLSAEQRQAARDYVEEHVAEARRVGCAPPATHGSAYSSRLAVTLP
jgi:3-hydroxybutyryl-CoA dehydrogenase